MKEEQYSLEELNQQFLSNIKKKKKHKGVSGIWLLVLLIVVVLMVVLIVWKITSTQTAGGTSEGTAASESIEDTEDTETLNESILSEAEQEKWMSTSVDSENIYVELNSTIYLDGSKAYIRMINPIYSTYYYSITIYPEAEENTIFYQSEKVAPGTILEAVMLTAEPTKEQYSAVVKYRVFDGNGNELGTYPVNVEFTTDEQYK